MPDVPDPPPPASARPALRASDADREAIADVLRGAAGEGRLDVDELDERLTAAYGARTHAELEPLIADVVAEPGGHRLAPAPRAEGRMPVKRGAAGTGTLLAIMGGTDRSGVWTLAESVNVVSIMGGADVDLNDAVLTAELTTMNVISVMGGSDIYVPEHLNVEVTSVPIMGGHDVKLGDQHPDPGGPVLKLRLISVMGGSNVRRGRKKGWREKLDEHRERRTERIERREARRAEHRDRHRGGH